MQIRDTPNRCPKPCGGALQLSYASPVLHHVPVTGLPTGKTIYYSVGEHHWQHAVTRASSNLPRCWVVHHQQFCCSENFGAFAQ